MCFWIIYFFNTIPMLNKWSFLCLGSWSWMSLIEKTKSIRNVVDFQSTNWPARPSFVNFFLKKNKQLVHSIPRKNPQSKCYNFHCRREKKKAQKLRLLTCAHEVSTLWSWVSGPKSLVRQKRERVMNKDIKWPTQWFLSTTTYQFTNVGQFI